MRLQLCGTACEESRGTQRKASSAPCGPPQAHVRAGSPFPLNPAKLHFNPPRPCFLSQPPCRSMPLILRMITESSIAYSRRSHRWNSRRLNSDGRRGRQSAGVLYCRLAHVVLHRHNNTAKDKSAQTSRHADDTLRSFQTPWLVCCCE